MNLLARLRDWWLPACARCGVRSDGRVFCRGCCRVLPSELQGRWIVAQGRQAGDPDAYWLVRGEVDGWFELDGRAMR